MQLTVAFKWRPLHPNPFFLLHSAGNSSVFLRSVNISLPKVSYTGDSHFLSHGNLTGRPIICARRRKSRNGYRRIGRFVLNLIAIYGLNPKFFPQPLDLVVEGAIGDGDGGKLGFWNRFGGAGFGGWRRRGKGNLGAIRVLVVCGLFLLFKGDTKSEMLWRVVVFGLIGAGWAKSWSKRTIRNWVLGFCWFAVFMALGMSMRRKDVQKWAVKFRSCSPLKEFVMKCKKGRKSLR